MSLSIYMDAHVPGTITHGLRRAGVDVLTAQEDGRDRRDDDELMDRATELRRVVFTEDQGFFKEAARRQRAGQSFAGVFFMAQYRLSHRQCIDELKLIAECTDWDDWIGQINSIPLGV